MPEINPPDNLPTDEPQEFFKREEIKTMERDIAELREAEAKEEKERITSLNPEIKIQQPSPFKADEVKDEAVLHRPPAPIIPPISKQERPVPPIPIIPPIIPPVPPFFAKAPEDKPIPPAIKEGKPTFSRLFKKIIIRGLVIFLCFLVLGFSFWLWQGKKLTTQKQPTKTEEPAPEPELSLPPSLISTQDTKVVSVSTNEEIPALLEQLAKTEIATNTFSRIAIKNSQENRWVSLSDLNSAFKINVSLEIIEKLESDFTLALFSQKEGKRIALIAKTADSAGLTAILKTWDESIAKSKVAVGEKQFQPLASFFRTYKYQGISFKYLTFSRNDLGIVYLVLDNYFVLTSSFGSMQDIIDEIIATKK